MNNTRKNSIKLNSKGKLESLMQEIYDESCRQINQAQDNITKIQEATKLSDTTMDEKAKYGKIINDFLTQKNNALAKKMDISKLLLEVLKQKGDVAGAIGQMQNQQTESFDLGAIMKKVQEEASKNNDTEQYNIKLK